jgi:hypothetical protein
MNEPDQTTNSPDRPDPDVSIDSGHRCFYCHSPITLIFLRPFPLCTPCMYELADIIDKVRSNPIEIDSHETKHSHN